MVKIMKMLPVLSQTASSMHTFISSV